MTIETLENWARSGAHWRVLHLSERLAVVELQRCTGEPIERLESRETAVIAYLDGVGSDLDVTTNDADRRGSHDDEGSRA